MAQFVRIIPNRLYNDLIERGLLQSSDAYMTDKPTAQEIIVSFLPATLQTHISPLLAKLVSQSLLSLDDNSEIVTIDDSKLSFKELALLFEKYIVEDRTLLDSEYGLLLIKKLRHIGLVSKLDHEVKEDNKSKDPRGNINECHKETTASDHLDISATPISNSKNCQARDKKSLKEENPLKWITFESAFRFAYK